MTIAGRTEIIIDNNGGKIFTGFKNIGITKYFDWNEISDIKEEKQIFNFPGSGGGSISLEGAKRITLARFLNEPKRYYLYKALQTLKYKGNTEGHYV